MSENQEKLNEQLFNVIADEKVSDEAKLKKLKYLLYLGADVNTRLYGKSVLSKAIEQNAGAQVQNFLREKGANEWVISKEEALELGRGFWNDKGELKSLEEIKQLLKKGADLEAKDDEYGRTALMKAARSGQLDVVEYLVQSGADVNVKDGWHGRTALMWAANWGKLDVVKCLVEHGADLEAKDKDGRTVLDIARECRKADCVKFLEELQPKEVAKKLSQGFWDDEGDLKSLEEIKELIKKGADVNAQYKYGETALMTAAYNGEIDMAKCLFENGADVNASSKYGKTALMIAATWGQIEVVKYLAKCGADLEAEDKDGKTALDMAENRKRYDCVEFLEGYKKIVSAQKYKGIKREYLRLLRQMEEDSK